ncbi:MAG: sigma-70 family RNA polymerase sigma factor [Bacilli bacterium]|nr:sigma-70 family RNA polymerase sigma factor [Bacilli bacterium]
MDNLGEIIVANEGLIYKIINKYRNYFEIEDLYQVAVMGLIKASKNYNSEYGAKFTSYAYPFILGEVIKYINEFRNIKINKDVAKLYTKILKAIEILSQKLMKMPSNYELSLFLEIDESLIEEVLMANTTVESLDRIISQDGKDLELYNKYGYCDHGIENYPLISELEKLPPLERAIIQARYYENMSQRETGITLGMYQVEVSRREKRILEKLKDNIAA